MFPEKDQDKIEGLNQDLYSRTRYHDPIDNREAISETTASAPQEFDSPHIDELLASDRRRPEPYPLIKKIFLVASLFCACAVIAAALIYFKGDNFISTKNLDISVEGPVSVSAGSPVEFRVTVKNNNNAALSSVALHITYPDGTRNADNPTEELNSSRETLEALGAGDKIAKTERAIFLGAEGDVKQVRMRVDYRVAGSNATFTKEKVFEVTIGNAPVALSVSHPESITSGEPFTMTVNLVANSEEVLKNIVLRSEYPYGWVVQSATPAATGNDKNVWSLGDLSPGDKKSVTLRGILTGEDEDERTFRFFVGSAKGGGNTFDTPLSTGSIVLAIRRPSIDLAIRFNGEAVTNYSAPAGKPVQMVIRAKNNLPASLLNPQLEVKFSGSALDRQSVTPGSGLYNSLQNTVVWNQGNDPDFDTLAPGSEEQVSVNFASLETLPAGSANQRIDMTITLSGVNQETNRPVSVTETRSVRLASEVSLSSRATYSHGVFSNAGPIPPKAEVETTYAIELEIGNTQNDIEDVRVTGTLGANVEWLGYTSPSGGAITYDPNTRLVTWQVGTVQSGAGFSSNSKRASFQIALTPSLGQVGGVPVLLSNVSLTGRDSFTEAEVRVTNASVTTKISSDPRYVQGDEIVVK